MNRANQICRMDAVTLAAQVRAKTLSASEVTEAVLARLAVLEPHLHAFCTPTPAARRRKKRLPPSSARRRWQMPPSPTPAPTRW